MLVIGTRSYDRSIGMMHDEAPVIGVLLIEPVIGLRPIRGCFK